ncbi:hypothetical protein Patl1_12332 [Pistacia atlantica]|uniref:Uncharacterized protein n=1 Tax=Pistacia atlantica TaxID=434234 RepID=A0ACC1A3K8_9ROSI|nr:hypothetical protein Patl1_12332 [Pistacia atlantica]
MASCQVNLPHNLDLILENADDQSLKDKDRDKLIDELHAGVFLNNKKQKFWVDKITSANSFELYATDLSIDWGQDISHWRWSSMKDTNGDQMEMAVLVSVWWLGVKNKFPTKMLTPGASYEISFVLKMEEYCKGFENNPVKLKLVLPNQDPIERTEDLSSISKEKWTEIRVGEFVTSCNTPVDMEISMYEHNRIRKQGLVVNKIIIRPVIWKELSGQRNWDGLLSPLKNDLRKRIIDCGKSVDFIYRSIDEKGLPRHTENDLFRLLSEVSPTEDNPSAEPLYEVIKYIYAWVDVAAKADWLLPDKSTWIGYVAKTTLIGKKVLGRADILICWRGTVFKGEWERNFAFTQTRAVEVFPNSAHAFVHQGFYSLYTSSKTDPPYTESARVQVREAVKALLDEYKNEPAVSITITGHSLGAALATLNAADIVSNQYNMRTGSNACLVTAIVFASPVVGNYGFHLEFKKLQNLHLLHIKHNDDVITKIPFYNFTSVGKELLIHTTLSTYESNKKLPLPEAFKKVHNLKNYIRELEGRKARRDDLYLAAKKHDDGSWELYEVPIPDAPST